MTDEDRPYITRAQIQNYGCVRDVTLELTRLHALIGPNDSGKSTVLSALRRIGTTWGAEPTDPTDPRRTKATRFDVGVQGAKESAWLQLKPLAESAAFYGAGSSDKYDLARRATSGATLLRVDPDVMRRPCALIPEGSLLTIGEKGENLAGIYDAVLSRDREAFIEIEQSVRRLFPTVKSIWLPAFSQREKTLGLILNDGTSVRADTMSEGLLYWLAFAALPRLDMNGLLLIEEPENGLHPARIADVMKALRAISSRMQVILATHSPLVINEMAPEEVTILTRDEKTGTKATRIDRTTHFKQREKVYALGELWLSFADGNDEAALVPETSESAS